MNLIFVVKSQFGKIRYFPTNAVAIAVVDLTGRKCLKEEELNNLQLVGFSIEVNEVNAKEKSI